MFKKNYSTAGFTLIEMLIAISIFMIFVAMMGGSYVSLSNTNQSANQTQKVYRQIRNVSDTFSQGIRTGAFDYGCLEGTGDPYCSENQGGSQKIVFGIQSGDGQSRMLYKFDETKKQIIVLQQTRLLGDLTGAWVTKSDGWIPLHTNELKPEEMKFEVFPLLNPYDATNASDDMSQVQPYVTIHLKANNYDFQTTYSSRTYGKRSLYE